MAQVRAGGSTTDFQSLDGVLSFFLVENGDTLVAGFNGANANSLEEVRQVIEQRGTAVGGRPHGSVRRHGGCAGSECRPPGGVPEKEGSIRQYPFPVLLRQRRLPL